MNQNLWPNPAFERPAASEQDMGAHDSYGKLVLRQPAGDAFIDSGSAVTISYGGRGGATIDGVVAERVAVEIESRVSKQVRGALLDLICHPYKKKLLVLLLVHISNPKLCASQCEYIFVKFVDPHNFRSNRGQTTV